MSAIDLIPASYHSRIKARRVLHRLGIALLCLGTVAFAAGVAIQWQLQLETQRLLPLREAAARSVELRTQIDRMTQSRKQLAQAVAVQAALRGEGHAAQALRGLDQAMNEGVWLSHLHFQQAHRQLDAAGSQQPAAAPAAAETKDKEREMEAGTTIRMEIEDGKTRKEQSWHFATSLELRGNAVDHAALAAFLQGLSVQPGLAHTRLLRSRAGSAEASGLVEFDIDAAVLPKGAAW